MRTRVVQYMTFLCLICVAGLATAALQDQPEVKKRVNPWYPEVLKRAGVEGEVFLKVFIDEKGRVEKTEAIKSTHPDFIEAATAAARQWEFSPAMKDGKPIKSEVTIPFRFKLAEGSDKPKREELMGLQEDVHKLLCGDAPESVKSKIGAEAYAVVGNKYEFLSPLFSDKTKRDILIEGRDSKFEMSHLVVGDAGDMACLVLKTRPAAGKAERYHTVIFSKSKDGKWAISAWHAGQ